MVAAKEGRTEASRRLRSAIVWLSIATAYAFALSFYKSALLERLAQQGFQSLKTRHQKVLNLFQASFYFFYEDQFLPGIKENLAQSQPQIERILIISSSGSLLFDSRAGTPGAPREEPKPFGQKEIVEKLGSGNPSVFISGFQAQVLVPAGQYGVLYVFDGSSVRLRLLLLFIGGMALAVGVHWLLARDVLGQLTPHFHVFTKKFWGLRIKFLVTIVMINVITASIVFFTLSDLQTREQTRRIEKQAQVFSEFSTAEVISNFTNFFYFYYKERFIPGVKRVIASNEDLLGIRIISYRNHAVLFDSEQAGDGPTSLQFTDLPKVEFPEDVAARLKAGDVAKRNLNRNGVPLLSIITTYKNENQEPIFWVEYLFSYQSLSDSIRAIRHRILVDLVPSLILGLVIAAFFARLLIAPIRRLVGAVQRVTAGDYDVAVEINKTDEIGELVTAFNTMTGELRKKKELRKYLSDSTYRQVQEAADSPGGLKLGGSRVFATILFSDIRDFVAHCESLEAEEVTAMLNEYFSEMVDVVYKNGGEVDKFIGDAILAVFYSSDEARVIRKVDTVSAPSSSATAMQAIHCALEMRERLAEFNNRRKAMGKSTIEIGVGITHGEIISGPIGSKDRMDFTVIGDVVNLANRIEKLSKEGKFTKIVFSNHVEEKVRGLLDYEEVPVKKVRGKEENVSVYELIGIRNFEVLIENLKSEDGNLRVRSIELLGQSRNIEALPHLVAALEDDDEKIRIQSVSAAVKLAKKDDEKVLDALFRRLKVEKSEKVISALLSAIGKLCVTERVLEVAPFLEFPNERIVANAIEALAQVRNPKCTDLILPKLSNVNNRIKANAAMALFAAGHTQVLGTLKPMLMHSDPLMRSSAAFALGELTYLAEKDSLIKTWQSKFENAKPFLAELQECVPMLVALLRDTDPMVKRQAVIALGKIKDKSAVLPIIDTIDSEKISKELIQDIAQALREIGSHRLVREVISKFN